MIDVAVLGATGTVGQKFIKLLEKHPQFRVRELVASARSAGKQYRDACEWKQETCVPADLAPCIVKDTDASLRSPLLFSGLDSSVAYEVEQRYAEKGHVVVSNARNHRMASNVPLVIPEINHEHLFAVKEQHYRGAIITNPNCSTIAITLPIGVLHREFTITGLMAHSMQAVSGAGYPGVASLDIVDNVVPFISGEEEKIETEPLKILGNYEQGTGISKANFPISAHCNRVPVLDGHTICISLSLEKATTVEEIIAAWNSFAGFPQEKKLHSAPEKPLLYLYEHDRPQPRLDRMKGNGMATSIGRLRPDSLFDYKFVSMSHNTIRGAAGAAILNAETFIALGLRKEYF